MIVWLFVQNMAFSPEQNYFKKVAKFPPHSLPCRANKSKSQKELKKRRPRRKRPGLPIKGLTHITCPDKRVSFSPQGNRTTNSMGVRLDKNRGLSTWAPRELISTRKESGTGWPFNSWRDSRTGKRWTLRPTFLFVIPRSLLIALTYTASADCLNNLNLRKTVL